MIPSPVRMYNPQGGADRLAVVSVEPSLSHEGTYLVRLARGPRTGKLGKGMVYGPYPEDQLPAQVAEVVVSLEAEGFLPAGLQAMLAALGSPDPAVRARAAARLGWRRERRAVDALLAALPQAAGDVCALADALGAIGDPRAVPAVRPLAARKLLSRRRSAVEALRNLGDTAGLAEARQLALERLPEPVRQALGGVDENAAGGGGGQGLLQSVLAAPAQHQGLVLDTLYELATPTAVAAARAALRQMAFDQPHLWRYVKSIYKRALLRHDYTTFGQVAHDIEAQGRQSHGTSATVKSGLDGVQRQTGIFRRKTQDYLRRLGWRYLRMMAAHRPESYAPAAAEVLIRYVPEDAQQPRGLSGEFASCYLLHRILWGGSKRFAFDSRSVRFRFRSAKLVKTPADTREEAFPELWDAQPRAYLRVLCAAKLPEAHALAVRAVAGPFRKVLEEANAGEVLALLEAPYEPTVQLGLEELGRRFDPARPDWGLLERLLADVRPRARELGERWLRLTAPLWASDPDRTVAFLTSPDGVLRSLVAELTLSSVGKDPGFRQALARRILAVLRAPEAVPGVHEACARVAREGLADEINALVSVADLVAMAAGGSPGAQAVAGDLLGRRPEAVAELGLERLTALAQHEIAAVRAAAQRLIRSAIALLRSDPSPLFVLVESDWEDTRKAAFDILREQIDPATLGLEGLRGLIDSNRVDVQDLGRELILMYFSALPTETLVFSLAEHPHPNVRRFALELAVQHLPDGAEPLARLEPFFRAVLFDLWPERPVKRQAVDFLVARGLRDERQAEVAAGLLGEVVRFQGRADFERALEGLVRIRLAYPEVNSAVRVAQEGLA